MVVRLEVWQRAVQELRRLGFDAGVAIGSDGVRVWATDGAKLIDRVLPAADVMHDRDDIVLRQLMQSADTLINGPVLVLIDGDKSRKM